MIVDKKSETLYIEEEFHDRWASSVNVSQIDVIKVNQVCTAPEMRFITQRLFPLKDKTILDIGCGLGEASVYFALQGAKVTATDLSEGMLLATEALAKMNGVQVETHKSSAEHFDLDQRTFDFIYVGNLFHHVDIEATILRIKKLMSPHTVLVSWDPLAYNPLINVYRKIATETRTPDEHPFTLQDINLFRRHFRSVQVEYYWLTTLIIFLAMFILQRRNPNKERFWKKVVDEGDQWSWLYVPLEKLDRLILRIVPAVGLLCWNVVLVASGPQE